MSDLMLLEMAVNLSLAIKTKENIVNEFVEIVINLIEEVPSLVPSYMPIIKLLCAEISISKAKTIWPLVIRLRAE